MKFHATDTDISELEESLAQPWGEDVLAATVTLAWYLRQRDSARALRLVEGLLPLLAPLAEGSARPDARRARAALAACEACALLCDVEAAERWLLEARRSLDLRADARAEGDAWLVEAVVAKMRVQRPRELAAHEHALACFEAMAAPDRLAIAQVWLGFERGCAQLGIDHCIGLQPPGEAWPAAAMVWEALWNASRGMALSVRDPSGAARLHRRAAARASAVGMVRLEIFCLINAGAALQGVGDFDAAAACLEQAAARAGATGWPTLAGAANARVGDLMRELGAYEESRMILEDALAVLASGAPGMHAAVASAALAETLRAMGRGEESLAPMRRAVALYRELGVAQALARSLVVQARGLAAANRPHDALAACDEAAALIAANQFVALDVDLNEVLAELHLRLSLPAPAGMTLPGAALHHGEMALAQGRRIATWTAPARLLAFLAERWAEVGDHAKAYDYARQALAASQKESLQKMNHPQALARLRRRTMPGEAAAAATSQAQDAGVAHARRRASRTLTPKERSILLLLARDYSNKEIARSIAVSDETVKWHLKNLFNKLEAGSRKHAVARARSLGFLAFAS